MSEILQIYIILPFSDASWFDFFPKKIGFPFFMSHSYLRASDSPVSMCPSFHPWDRGATTSTFAANGGFLQGGPPSHKRDPYQFHTLRDSYGSGV